MNPSAPSRVDISCIVLGELWLSSAEMRVQTRSIASRSVPAARTCATDKEIVVVSAHLAFFAAAAFWTPWIAKHLGSIRETKNSIIWVTAVFGTWMVFLVPLIIVMYSRVDKVYEDARLRRENARPVRKESCLLTADLRAADLRAASSRTASSRTARSRTASSRAPRGNVLMPPSATY